MNKLSKSPNRYISTRKSVFCLAAFMLAALTSFAASALADVVYNPFVKVDVNSAGSATMTGYDALNFTNSVGAQTVNYAPGISVTAAHETGNNHRNRSSNDGGDELTSDFIYETTKPVTVTVTGLEVGKKYSLKLFSHDTNANNGSSSTWIITQGENSSQIGTITNTVDKNHAKSTDESTYLAYTFTAEANTAVITGSSTNFVCFNGLDLSEEYTGLTRFDINSDAHLNAVRATELYFPDNEQTSATATAPSGIKMTVSSDSNLSSRTRSEDNANLDMRMYKDFIYSSNNSPITTTLENLKSDTIYRLTVYSIDPHLDQSAGIWTMIDANGKTLVIKDHNTTKSDISTWSFDQYFKPATTTVTMDVVKGSKAYTMFNGLQLQEISQDTANYTWAAGRAQWLADGKWVDKQGVAGVPAAGDICYVTSPDPTGMNTSYWLEITTTPFDATLVMASGSRLIFKSNATANDMILDGGFIHHGEGDKTFSLSGKLCVTSDSTIDIDDGSKRTLQIKSTLSGSGNLAINGNGVSNAVVELNNSNSSSYLGKFILNKVNLKLTGANACVGTGDLDIPSTSQLTLDGPNAGLHYVSNLTGSGPISVTATSRFDLASSEPLAYNGTISIAGSKDLHIGYTTPTADCAADVNLPNATVSLASGANLGLIHESNSAKQTTLVIGTLNGVSGSVVRASGSVNSGGTKYATLTVGQGDFAGVIGGSNSSHNKMRLIKNTDGTLTLSGKNIYVGGTDIQAGKIILTGAGTLGTGAVTIGENGTLEFAHDSDQTFSNAVSGTGALSKTGSGTLTLSGNNTYTGGTDIQKGKIVLTGNGTLGTGAVTIGENGTLEFDVAGGSTKKITISSPITGSGKITKTGDGVLQLYAAAEGLVEASSFVVSSGRLDMKEFFKGTLEIGSDAEFSPGNSVGTLNVDGVFKADALSTLIFEQDANGMDSLSASSFDIAPNAEIQLDITAISPGATYDIIVNTSDAGFTAEQGSESFWLNLLADDLPYYLNLSVVNNHMVRLHIDANAVPEPSTWALLVLGAVGLMYLRRRVRS